MKTIIGIQYLRAIAVILVVFTHASVMVNLSLVGATGEEGVDIFFVISGFIMAYSTRRVVESKNKIKETQKFLVRRFIRVVPLYWIALLWAAKLELVKNGLTLNLIQDFLFLTRLHSTGEIWPVLIVGWTLNYEIFFYIVFGLCFVFGYWRYLSLILIFSLLVLMGHIDDSNSVIKQFYTSSIILEFVLGIGVYYLSNKLLLSKTNATILILCAIIILFKDNSGLTRAIADGLPASMIVYSAIILFKDSSFSILNKLGEASYSIYLFHLGIFSLLGHFLVAFKFDITQYPYLVLVLILTALGCGLIIYNYLEKPLLQFLKSKFE